MTKTELLNKLQECQNEDTEGGHLDADRALLEYINDEDVTVAFKNISKWYA